MSSSTPASCADGSASTPSRSAARATASASMRSDLPRSRPRAPRVGHQLGRDAHDPLAAADQKPLQGARRRAGSPPAPTPARRRARAPSRAARETRCRRPGPSCSPSSSPVAAATAAIVCERLCVSAPSTIIRLVLLFTSTDSWTPGGHGLLEGAATLLICAGTRRQALGHVLSVDGFGAGGGAWARLAVRVVCARAPSLISVRGPAVRQGRRHDG